MLSNRLMKLSSVVIPVFLASCAVVSIAQSTGPGADWEEYYKTKDDNFEKVTYVKKCRYDKKDQCPTIELEKGVLSDIISDDFNPGERPVLDWLGNYYRSRVVNQFGHGMLDTERETLGGAEVDIVTSTLEDRIIRTLLTVQNDLYIICMYVATNNDYSSELPTSDAFCKSAIQ